MSVFNDLFYHLPDDAIILIALLIPIKYITRLSQTSIRLNNLICNNNNFWRQKFTYDFEEPSLDVNIVSWKEEYQNYGKVIAFGNNKYGQLGLSNILTISIPTLIPNIRAKSIFSGSYHKMIIDFNDNIWAFGFNSSRQLGLDDTQNRLIPTQIPNMKAKSVSCNGSYTMLIDLNNNVWACGSNWDGQLGLGDTQYRNNLTQLTHVKAKSVSCSGHTMIIDLSDNV